MEPTFGYLVSDVARLLRKIFDQRARQVGLSLAQCRALVYLAHYEGINQACLADLLEVQPISLTRLLDRMEAADWIERRADPADRRAHRLYLSEKARPLLELVQQLSLQARLEALAGFSEEEKTVLMGFLSRVHGNLCSRAPACHPVSEPVDDKQELAR